MGCRSGLHPPPSSGALAFNSGKEKQTKQSRVGGAGWGGERRHTRTDPTPEDPAELAPGWHREGVQVPSHQALQGRCICTRGSGGHARSPTRTTGVADRLALWRRWASLDWEGGDSCRQREVARMTTGWSCPVSSSHWASCRFMAMASAAKDVRSLAQLFLGIGWVTVIKVYLSLQPLWGIHPNSRPFQVPRPQIGAVGSPPTSQCSGAWSPLRLRGSVLSTRWTTARLWLRSPSTPGK